MRASADVADMGNSAVDEVREQTRLADLSSYDILDTPPEDAFDAIAAAASLVAGVPVAAIGLIDERREWFKASVGLPFDSVERENAFCDYVVRDNAVVVVADATADDRFMVNPFVLAEGGIRFYAGFPLVTPTGSVLGSLCVSDAEPRELNGDQIAVLRVLAEQVMTQLELRKQIAAAEGARAGAQQREGLLDAVLDSVDVAILVVDEHGQLIEHNAGGASLMGLGDESMAHLSRDERNALLPLATRAGQPISEAERPLARLLRDGDLADTEVVIHPDTDRAKIFRVRGRTLHAADGRNLGAMVACHDVTETRAREEELSARVRDVERLAEASRQILAGQDAMQNACEAVQALCDAQQVSVFVPDEIGNLTCAATTEPAMATVVVAAKSSSLIGVAFDSRQPLLVNPHTDPRANTAAMLIIEDLHGRVEGALYVPLVHDDECVGVMALTMGRSIGALPSRVFGMIEILTGELSTTLERERLRRMLATRASTDPLTGLANRRTWDERIAEQLDAGGPQAPICVAIIDLDHFKAFNDSFGHQAGDALLREATSSWATTVRSSDTLARLGGEEFGLLLPGCALPDAIRVLEGLRSMVPQGQSVSVGIAELRAAESADAWYARADRALYQAKASGRDRVVVDTGEFHDRRTQGRVAAS